MTESTIDANPLDPTVRTVRDLLCASGRLGRPIRIPDYQRPYKWSVTNVAQLIDDIDHFRASGRYRIGTVILHDNKDEQQRRVLDIVDGQQRFITFALLTHFLDPDDVTLTKGVEDQTVSKNGLAITSANIRDNYAYIEDVLGRRSREQREAFAEFFLDNCEVVVLTLRKADEAFQMFDSQNTRGRALYPTDLLKAFHIREMSSEHVSPALRLAMVRLWEAIPPKLVNELFSEHLFKIKRWANGRSVPDRGFSTSDIALFKGIRESDNNNAHNRWAMPFLYAKNYADDFGQENGTLIRYGAMKAVEYPFQIDQPVINGEIFFKMVAHYYELGRKCGLFSPDQGQVVELLGPLKSTVEELDKHKRDPRYAYVRNLLNCLLLYYVDRFDEQELDRAVDLVVRYSLALRVVQKQVRRVTVNKYALGSPPNSELLPSINLFRELREALRAVDFLQRPPPAVATFERFGELKPFFTSLEGASDD